MSKGMIKLVWVLLFSISMGFLESAVVIYLRELYYPTGFNFPLVPIPFHIALVELYRELATVIMLIGVGYLAGKSKAERIAYFVLSFAIWDVFYYVFLKVFIDWPESFFTMDLLFLIPIPWVGPVLAPILVSVLLGTYASIVIRKEMAGDVTIMRRSEKLLILTGFILILWTFVFDYLNQAQHENWLNAESNLFADMSSFVPLKFKWVEFGLGLLLSSIGVLRFCGSSEFRD